MREAADSAAVRTTTHCPMNSDTNHDSSRRKFAREVVVRLRDAGFESLWAGGCVRDDLLGLVPGDYDVATSATPEQVIELFGKRRTVAVGAAFGVVMVLGPEKECGQVEVATFRADGEYQDGRRPQSVTFCSAKEDAKRRDFTINGMFFDPVQERVIDYVGGQQDLQRRLLRAIGTPAARFDEDKLRILRAVRFAATYDLELDPATAEGVRQFAGQITVVSAERISAELKRMLAHPGRARAFRLLIDLEVAQVLFPELSIADQGDHIVDSIARLECSAFTPAMAILLKPLAVEELSNRSPQSRQLRSVRAVCRRMKFSNEETDEVCWLLEQLPFAESAPRQPLHIVKRLLADQRYPLLMDLLQAEASALDHSDESVQYLRRLRETLTADHIDPKPLVDGQDLLKSGLPPGRVYAEFLQQIRNEQLDEQLLTREDALQRLQNLIARHRADSATT